MAGPTSRAALNTDELMAMALARSSCRSTIWMTKLCRAVASKALTSPSRAPSRMTCQTLTTPASVRAMSTKAWTIASAWVAITVRCRFQRSVSTPATRQNQGRGDLRGEVGQAEQERRVAQPVDEPDRGDLLHPGADDRDALAEDEEPEVAMRQRAAHGRQPSGLRTAGVLA